MKGALDLDAHPPGSGAFRVLRGRPDPEELAAVLTVLTAVLHSTGTPQARGDVPEPAPWSHRAAGPRPFPPPGPANPTSWRTR